MYSWQIIPVVRVVIPFLAGVLFAINVNFFEKATYIFVFVGLLAFFIINEIFLFSYKWRWLRGLILTIAIFIISALFTKIHIGIEEPSHFSNFVKKGDYTIVQLSDNPIEKPNSIKCDVKVLSVKNDQKSRNVTGKAIVYLANDSNASELKAGDVLLLDANFNEIEPPLNPGQFNYKRFLYYKQIYHQAFVKNHWVKLEDDNNFINSIKHIRKEIVDLFNSKFKDQDAASIASALLVGYKVELSKEIQESFASTGAMHVLAVSGLHVGIIYLVLNYLFSFLAKFKRGNVVKLIIIIFLLWFYAFLTGLSPSVFRATIMFCMITIATNIKRFMSVFNSILTSLLVLLLIDPFMITQVGFQLSYAAVIGIVYIQPKLYELIKLPKVFDWIWKLTTVSLAAQIATFPLGLYYFNQFPLYFLVSNLIVIPAASIIIYLGIGFILAFFLGFNGLAMPLGSLLEWVIKSLNFLILKIKNFPGGLVEEVYLSGIGLLFLYGAIIFFLFYLIRKQNRWLILNLAMVALFILNVNYWKYKNMTQKRVVVYAVKNQTLIGFFDRGNVVYYGDSILLHDYYNLKYNTFRDLWSNGLKYRNLIKIEKGELFSSDHIRIGKNLIQFYDKTFYVLEKGSTNQITSPLKLDYIICSGTPFINDEVLKKYWNDGCFIIDASSSYWVKKYWIKAFENTDSDYYDITKNGAYVLRF